MIQTNLFANQKYRGRHREQMYGHRGKKWGGKNWETGIDMHTLSMLCIKQMTNENLPEHKELNSLW